MMRRSAPSGPRTAPAREKRQIPIRLMLSSPDRSQKDRPSAVAIRRQPPGGRPTDTGTEVPGFRNYKPDVLYTILGSNGMMVLSSRKSEVQFQLPLVVHVMDDWASSAHRHGILRHQLNFFAHAGAWLNHFFLNRQQPPSEFSPAMCEAYYAQRYGRQFTPFQYAS